MDFSISDYEIIVDSHSPAPSIRPRDELQTVDSSYLRGIVDMGSNGIRFSVTDLSPPFSRILPTIHVYRVSISLYDAQFDPETGHQVPIPPDTIDDVIAALNRFKIVCTDLGVPQANIHVVATEATRAALNSAEFIKKINAATGLVVDMLPKEDEGRIGSLGVASGFSDIRGLMMDLGGGSTQITWIISQGGNVRISDKGSISFPYGAAALTKTLEDLKRGKSKHEAEKAREKLRQEMTKNFEDAYKSLRIPESLVEEAKTNGGFPLYLSGGGFRGWGYLLLYMSQTGEKPHPISIINGYTVGKERFENTKAMEEVARNAHSVFRVSDRRRKQVPAVAFLINALSNAIPHGIRLAHFCQGGVREGLLFRELEPSIRAQDPLEVTTQRFAPESVEALYNLLMFSFPKPSQGGTRRFPESISKHVIRGFANIMYVHTIMDKELASTAAMYSTSTGLLAFTRGVSHEDRARLALMLESRYMGELPPRESKFKEALQSIITPEEVWWAAYLGRVGYLLGRLYPSGKVDESKPRIVLSSEWAWDLGHKKKGEGVQLTISIQKMKHDPAKLKKALRDHVNIVEKIGKKKNWIGGPDGWGMKVKLKIVEEDILILSDNSLY
ncbi:Ppx/GppA phosphatase family-domain-containing protein [Fusarium redolens]|uniref:Ppx/GppA phosphatase family-domain-containing protein n=1 Tax=Fusarium redolens TaxID=48865 RepID=A0A9P9JKY3_FUSRE|nr:Ppx/GppA phosphatase family-domain-containing protein [Fusarium redolens]KAH7216866.1 Ppx/GppA phosphatase family-domain-containing protein [Fusarium redolens]